MTERNLAAIVRLSTLAFVLSACSGSAGGNGDTTASGGAGGASTGGKATGGIAAVGGASIGGAAAGGTVAGGAGASGGSKATGGGATGGNAAGGASTGGAASVGGGATGGNATGGAGTSGGGNATGGSATGGKATGGASTGGVASVGGSATGGKSTGGSATGGAAAGGTNTGGKATGGSATGGKATGGSSAGGVAATGGGATGGSATCGASGGIVLPTANASFDYQIGGAYTPPSGVRVVSRDRNSAPATGLYNICYVNGFQIQTDEESFWTSQHPTLILRDSSGNPIIDANWGEMLLDTSSAAKRTELAAIVGSLITKFKTDGFNAVEIDNLDSYSRSSGLLTQANNIAFMALLSAVAHQNCLAIAQKNSSELVGSKAAMGTDFAVVEECNRYSECGTYTAVYGNLVFIIEYRAQDFQVGCTTYPELSIVLRDLNVSTPSSSSYVYQGC